MDTAQWLGWSVAHFRPMFDAKRKRWRTPATRDGVGWPDVVLVRDRIIYAELKSGTGRASPEQRAWLERLAAAGGECYIWRDTDYEAVVATLNSRRNTRA
jgi:VRR-NUC domain